MQGMKTMRMLIAAVVACVTLGAAAPAHAQDLDAALKPIATYKFGDSREALSVANDLLRKADNAGGEEQKAAEAKLLALLSSNPTPDCVDFICRQLAMIGSEASVPVLAPMLVKDEQSADWARYALEGISGEAVDKALLDALTSVSGRARRQ